VLHRVISKKRACGCIVAVLSGWMGLQDVRAQDPLTLPGKNYRVVIENSAVTVIRAHYGPHEKIPVHDHTSFSTVFVYLSDSGPVKISHEGEGPKDFAVTRPPTVKGAYRVAPGMAERHSIENLGEQSSDFLRVELKRVSLQMKEPFRGKAPALLSVSSDAVEFDQPGVEVERIVCSGDAACVVKAIDSPSLLVAFTDAGSMKAGEVRWLAASQGMTASGAAHLLRITLVGAR
jgi:hypothetical protein